MTHDETTDTVDVPGHEVAAHAVGHPQRTLEVDLGPLLQIAQRGRVGGLLRHVGQEGPADELDHGKARAIDGDRVADRHVAAELRRVDLDAHTTLGALDPCDDPLCLNESREHVRSDLLSLRGAQLCRSPDSHGIGSGDSRFPDREEAIESRDSQEIRVSVRRRGLGAEDASRVIHDELVDEAIVPERREESRAGLHEQMDNAHGAEDVESRREPSPLVVGDEVDIGWTVSGRPGGRIGRQDRPTAVVILCKNLRKSAGSSRGAGSQHEAPRLGAVRRRICRDQDAVGRSRPCVHLPQQQWREREEPW